MPIRAQAKATLIELTTATIIPFSLMIQDMTDGGGPGGGGGCGGGGGGGVDGVTRVSVTWETEGVALTTMPSSKEAETLLERLVATRSVTASAPVSLREVMT